MKRERKRETKRERKRGRKNERKKEREKERRKEEKRETKKRERDIYREREDLVEIILDIHELDHVILVLRSFVFECLLLLSMHHVQHLQYKTTYVGE